ncbi:50S ribosomal protein L10 [Ferroglobus sp.]|uniref:50S ribosomal protein L10 n=1 Tax=Ferroglobus sp. TaxID=2614230 RepID=UPI0025BE4F9A|nr:50S ribosomal protein L10 [Ferroglobus sp.]
MAAVTGQVPQWKRQAVEDIKKLLTSHPVVAIVGFRGVPSPQFQKIRRDFKEFAKIRVVKNSLLERALDELGGDFVKLKDFIEDQTAIVVSEMNPFKLYKKLEETKVPSPLKPNQVSPVDVVVEAGPTKFPPGPILGELQAGGIPAAIERGRVVVKNTVTVVKAGEVVKPEVARALQLLDVKPIKIGLETRAIMEKGIVFTPEDLAIDEAKVFEEFVDAARKALNLAVNAAYVTEETAEILIAKAFIDAKNLAINALIFEKDVMPEILAKAHSEMLALASLLPEDALDEELKKLVEGRKVEVKEEVKEEKKEEEEKEEEEEEEKAEEEALEGLGALFG